MHSLCRHPALPLVHSLRSHSAVLGQSELVACDGAPFTEGFTHGFISNNVFAESKA